MPVRPCIVRGCPEKTTGTRCAAHERELEAKRAAAEPWRRVYADRRWRKTRRIVIARDGFQCRVLENGCRCPYADETGRTLHAHHHPLGVRALLIRGLDPFDPDRCVTACPTHHARVEQKLREAAAKESTHAAAMARARARERA